MILSIHKHIGETMTEVLDRCLKEHSITDRATYAGRLDPAASGVVIILTGDDRFKKDYYLSAQKTYSVKMLFGIQTDTDDIFGIIEKYESGHTIPHELETHIQKLAGPLVQELHPFSGYRHLKQPLWKTATESTREKISKKREVFSVDIISNSTVSTDQLQSDLQALLTRPSLSQFRIGEIEKSWKQIPTGIDIPSIEMIVRVSSGTFIRSLARTLSEMTGIPVCAYRIHRTEVRISETEIIT